MSTPPVNEPALRPGSPSIVVFTNDAGEEETTLIDKKASDAFLKVSESAEEAPAPAAAPAASSEQDGTMRTQKPAE